MRHTQTSAAEQIAHRTHAPWPYTRLDVPALRAAGHRPHPIRQFVLKTRSRCNLACTYCYVYEMADQGWRAQPALMAPATAARAAERIAEHAAAHDLPRVDLVLHGGEPLLTAPARLAEPVDAVRAAVAAAAPRTRVTATVQTNGTLLTRGRLAALAAAGIRVGVSLDGGLPAHNTRRVDHAGRPGFAAAARGLRLLARHPDSYAGVLCVIDLAHDPVETYESLLAFAPPSVGLLLPLANWSSPPPGHRPAGPRTPTGSSPSSNAGGTTECGAPGSGPSRRSSPCCSACPPPPRPSGSRPPPPPSSRPTAPSNRPIR